MDEPPGTALAPTAIAASPRATEAEKDAAIAQAIELAGDGDSMMVIAQKLGISYERIRLWVLSKQPEAYRAAQSKAHAMRIIEADERLAAVDEGPYGFFYLKKADVQCKWTRFDAERRDPNNWAPRQELTGAGGTPLVPDAREIARRWAYLMEVGKGAEKAPIDVEVVAERTTPAAESPQSDSAVGESDGAR